MKTRIGTLFGCLVMVAVLGSAQQPGQRAWQHRLKLEIPLPVPVVALDPVNPYSVPVDTPPERLAAVPPRKLQLAGWAKVAAYVDSRGECHGAVPLELPFPGITQELTGDLMRTRFEPGRAGTGAQPSWTVLQIALAGKLKESAVVDQNLELPDPASPPRREPVGTVYPAGRLATLPAVDPSTITSPAVPRRLSIRIPGGEREASVHALVHVTATGRVDQFIPVGVAGGVVPWLSAYLASWRLEPATKDGEPVDCWMEDTARVRLKLGTLSSTSLRVLRDERFSPEGPSTS